MASLPYKDIVGSNPFTFLVGPDKKPYSIHSALVAHQSEALNALINGALKEAEEQCAVLEHFEEDTFVRFSQFVYTGGYDAPEPREWKKKQVSKTPDPEPALAPEVLTWYSREKKKQRKKAMSLSYYDDDPPDPDHRSPREQLRHEFNLLHPEQPVVKNTSNDWLDDDYTEVFLAHARLYVFADYYGISDLQNLALTKLRHGLGQYKLEKRGASAIVCLLDYCYSNTSNGEEQEDPLRRLVGMYAACNLEDLWKNDEFKKLVDTLDGFPGVLIAALLRRM